MLALMRKIFQWEIACLEDLAGVCLSTEGDGAGGEPIPWREGQAGCGYSFEEGMGELEGEGLLCTLAILGLTL